MKERRTAIVAAIVIAVVMAMVFFANRQTTASSSVGPPTAKPERNSRSTSSSSSARAVTKTPDAALPLPEPAISAEGLRLLGIAQDVETGAPIEGVEIAWWQSKPGSSYEAVSGDPVATAVTDARGRYAITAIPRREGLVGATKKGFAVVGDWMDLPYVRFDKDKREAVRDFHLRRTISISGIVRRSDGGPVKGGLVSWGGPYTPSMDAQIAPGGAFVLGVFPRSTGYVCARAFGFPLKNSEPIRVGVDPIKGIEIVVDPAAIIEGRVLSPDGAPIVGAVVGSTSDAVVEANGGYRLGPSRTRSVSDGRFVLDGITPHLLAASNEFETSNSNPKRAVCVFAKAPGFAESGSVSVAVGLGETARGVEIKLLPGHFLAGTVVDSTQAPVKDARVDASVPNVMLSRFVTITDESGRFRLEDLPPDDILNVYAISNDHQWMGNVNNQEVDRDNVVIELKPVKHLDTSWELVGTVVEDSTAQPIPGIRVSTPAKWTDQANTVALDPDLPGVFHQKGIFKDFVARYRIQAKGYVSVVTEPETLAEPDNGVVRRTYKMRRGERVIGRTVNKAGEPIEGVEIEWTAGYSEASPREPDPDNCTEITRSDADGKFVLNEASGGESTLMLYPPAPYVEHKVAVWIDGGSENDLGDIVLDGGRTLRVIVTSEPGGRTLRGKGVRLEGLPAWSFEGTTATTDESGAAVFSGLRDLKYQIVLLDSNLRLELGNLGELERTVRLPLGAGIMRAELRSQSQMGASYAGVERDWEGGKLWGRFDKHPIPANEPFEIPNLIAGDWSLHLGLARACGNIRRPVQVAPTGITDVVVEAGAGSIVGRVEDAAGNPVEGAQLKWRSAGEDGEPCANTDVSAGDGSFRLLNVPSGSCNLTVHAEGKGSRRLERIAVPDGGESEFLVIRLEGEGGGTLVSKAYDDREGSLIQGTWIGIQPLEGGDWIFRNGNPGTDGLQTISAISPGGYTVRVGADGYSSAERTVTFAGSETQEIEDILHVASRVVWNLEDSRGRPVAGAACRLVPLDAGTLESAHDGKTDEQGRFTVEEVRPGQYRSEALVNGQKVEIRFRVAERKNLFRTTRVP